MKPELCYECKGKPPLKEPEIIQVNGLMLHIKPDSVLCITCLEKKLSDELERLKKQGKDFLKNKSKTIEIDWKMIDGFEEKSRNFAYDVLFAMDIFSLFEEGNWQILADGGIILNPRRFQSALYFKNKQDVIDFTVATLSDTLYSWEIYMRIGEHYRGLNDGT